MASNDTRSKGELERRGYVYEKTEHWNPHAKKRKDMLGFLDAIGLKAGEPIVGVQTTSRGNISSRLKKILAEPRAKLWLETGQRIEIHGWDKYNPPGTKLTRWRVKIRKVQLHEFS